MNFINKSVQELLNESGPLTFLVGAGCSVDPPSNLPAGREMIEAIIKYSCADSEIKRLLELDNLRFEQIVEIFRDNLDKELKVIDYYGQCITPNRQHFFLADMITKGHFVMTTNFDFLIEYALQQSNISNDEIIPVITKNDFEKFNNPEFLFQQGKKAVYKIHGSTKNVITGEDTRNSLIATLEAFGSGKEGENVFQLEPFKRPLFENISKGRTLVIMGYSGSDDFDIVPTLKILNNVKNIIWINHTQEEKDINKIYRIDDSTVKESGNFDKIKKILIDIFKMHNSVHIYYVRINTDILVEKMFPFEVNSNRKEKLISPKLWFENKIGYPDNFIRNFIPYKIYYDFRDYSSAKECLDMINFYAKFQNNKKWISIVHKNMGMILYERGKLDGALENYQRALEINEQLGDLREKATIFNEIGTILKENGNFDKALEQYQKALAIADNSSDLKAKSRSLDNIGKLLYNRGILDDALENYQRALEIDEQLGDLRGKAIRLSNIGLIKQDRGKLDEALEYFQQALAIDEQLNDLKGIASNFYNIGRILRDEGDLDKALDYFKKALAIDEQLSDSRGKAIRFNSIGLILKQKGQIIYPLEHFRKALEINEQLGDLREKTISLSNIGLLLQEKGKLDQALIHFQQALGIANSLGDLPNKALFLNNIGQLLLDKGKIDDSLKYYEEAIENI